MRNLQKIPLKLLLFSFFLFFVKHVTYGQRPSSRMSLNEMKTYIRSLTIFKLSHIFYPDDSVKTTSSLPILNDAQTKEIEAYLQALLDSLAAQNDNLQNYREINTTYNRRLKRYEKLKIIVKDFNSPIAKTDVGNVFTIDIKVIQSIFRASLKFALSPGSDLGLYFSEINKSSLPTDTTELNQLQYFFDTKRKIEAVRKKGELRTIVASSLGGSGDFASLIELYFLSRRFQITFDFIMSFVLGHELGHVVLGHLDSLNTIRADATCRKFRKSEFEADIYATLIQLYFINHNESDADLQANFIFGGLKYEDLFEQEPFLSIAYNLAGFIDKDANSGCLYPSFEERIQVIKKFNDLGGPEGNPTYLDYQKYILRLK